MRRPTPASAGPTAPGRPATMRPRDFALVAGGAVAWGTGGIAGSLLAAGSGLSMLAVASYRLLVGGAIVVVALALAGHLRRVPVSRPVAARVAATGLLAALYQGCYFAAVALTTVSTATLVALGAAPILVVAATAVSTRQRPTARVTVAAAAALAGLALLLGAPAASSAGAGAALGLGLALAAAAAFAAMTMLNRRQVPGLDPLALTGLSFTAGGLVLLPLAALGAGLGAPHGAAGWVLLAFLGLVPTAGAYGAYFAGLCRVPATTAALLALLEPLTAAACAALVLGERLGPLGVAGGALLVAAVVLLRPRRWG
ncbi:EamA family transporter [Pengzhenrongella sicca]|uniref:EamA family transporter n=1 Tax=Pengzhenrongella sicca TaxID=2819238 RepID=A0A8A4ZG75_9MICO|nr:EamA family transporter [Pengzhenrongella sicca]QTE30285.1 EamA family transporter [Pengzhenrongella sicca]